MNSGLGIGEQSSRDYKTVVRPLFSFLAEIIKPWSVPYFPGLSPIFLVCPLFSYFLRSKTVVCPLFSLENRGLSPIFCGLSPIFETVVCPLFLPKTVVCPLFSKPWSVPYFLRADQETTARHKNLIDTSIR